MSKGHLVTLFFYLVVNFIIYNLKKTRRGELFGVWWWWWWFGGGEKGGHSDTSFGKMLEMYIKGGEIEKDFFFGWFGVSVESE